MLSLEAEKERGVPLSKLQTIYAEKKKKKKSNLSYQKSSESLDFPRFFFNLSEAGIKTQYHNKTVNKSVSQ